MTNKTKIFVDGNCVVCSAEITHYNRIAPGFFEVIDITHPDFNATQFNLTTAAVNKHMHVLTPEGDLKIGVDAFAHIWSRIERYKIASKLIQSPAIKPIAKVGYAVFAVLRPYLPKKK